MVIQGSLRPTSRGIPNTMVVGFIFMSMSLMCGMSVQNRAVLMVSAFQPPNSVLSSTMPTRTFFAPSSSSATLDLIRHHRSRTYKASDTEALHRHSYHHNHAANNGPWTLSLASSTEFGFSENQGDDGENSAVSTVPAATFSLIKAMVGSGVLALPAGLAAMSNFKSSLYVSNVILLIMTLLSGYTFALYGRLVHATQAKTLGDLWNQVYRRQSAFTVNACNFIYCCLCCLSFALVIGDSGSSLAQALHLPAILCQRQASILAVTVGILWPLCNLPSLTALAPVSLVGVLGTFVTTSFLAWRCPAVVATSPYALGTGTLLPTLAPHLRPSFDTYSRWNTPAPSILISMACFALMAHFSAPDFYQSFVDRKSSSSSSKATQAQTTTTTPLKKYLKTTYLGYAAVLLINVLSLTFGFLTFGGNAAGVILNNYSTADMGATVSRLLVAVSVTGAFPFLMFAGRASAIELFGSSRGTKPSEPTKAATRKRERKYTLAMLAAVTATAMMVKDAGFVIGFNGSLMGAAIVFLFPCLLFLKATAPSAVSETSPLGFGLPGPTVYNMATTAPRLLRLERWFCRFLLGFGGVMALLGAAASVINSYFPHLLL